METDVKKEGNEEEKEDMSGPLRTLAPDSEVIALQNEMMQCSLLTEF